MKILVTGSSGFIGALLCDRLAADGFTVRGFDNKCAVDQPFECVTGDIRDNHLLPKALNSIDIVVHLIAMHHDFGIADDEYFEINEKGTKDLLDCCSKTGVKRFVFFSSVAVYGTQPDPTDENTIPNPDTPYGKSKLAAERILERWQKADRSRQVIIIRPTVVFGPRNYANVYNLINQIYKKKFLMVGDGSNIKSVAYVENLVDATRFLIRQLKPGVAIYNYSDEPQMTIKEIVTTIAENANISIPERQLPFWAASLFGGVFHLLSKATGYNFPITRNRIKKFCTTTHHKANKVRKLGFKPRITLREGFKRTVDWYIANHNRESIVKTVTPGH
jgi:nucleoside-diphosphate-sugar epimerase